MVLYNGRPKKAGSAARRGSNTITAEVVRGMCPSLHGGHARARRPSGLAYYRPCLRRAHGRLMPFRDGPGVGQIARTDALACYFRPVAARCPIGGATKVGRPQTTGLAEVATVTQGTRPTTHGRKV